jgi:hypothetical protein
MSAHEYDTFGAVEYATKVRLWIVTREKNGLFADTRNMME